MIETTAITVKMAIILVSPVIRVAERFSKAVVVVVSGQKQQKVSSGRVGIDLLEVGALKATINATPETR